MKLNIISDDEQAIENFSNINVLKNTEELSEAIDHSFDEIVLYNTLHSLEQEHANEVLQLACGKLRLNGEIKIISVDAKNLCRMLLNNQLKQDDFSSIVSGMKCFISIQTIKDIFAKNGILISTSSIKGYGYEIRGVRPSSQN